MKEVRKATQHVADTLGYTIEETTKVTPEEYALGGFSGRKFQKTLSRLVKNHKVESIRKEFPEGWKKWLDGANTDEVPGASDWVTVTPNDT